MKMKFICEHCGAVFADMHQCTQHEKICRPEDPELYSKWCKELMGRIEEIANKKYPNMPYWLQTGSGCDVCMKMLDLFERDLK